MALYRIYFAEQTYPNKGKWEIYRHGVPTGDMVTATTIRKMLNKTQYQQFNNGDTIFMIAGEKIRTRSFKKKGSTKKVKRFKLK